MDEIYSHGPRTVYCAANLDTVSGNSVASVEGGLARAAARGEVIHLYAHQPGVTVPVDKLTEVIARAHDLGLPWLTYADLAANPSPGAGVALSFDDAHIDEWTALRPTFATYGVRATFFVTRYPQWSAAMKAELRQLADDGHDIEAHTINHLHAADYVADRGLAAWLDDEAVPSIDVLRADGYDPVAFAYPFGERTDETDRAIRHHVAVVRSIAFTFDSPVVVDPCPWP